MPFERLSESAAADIVGIYWGLDVDGIMRLNSERDDTFRIISKGASYLLKISHPADSVDRLSLQIKAMQALAESRDFLVPRMISAKDGRVLVNLAKTGRHARLLQYLPGEPLAGRILLPQNLIQIGATAARVSLALTELPVGNPGADSEWNLLNSPELFDHLKKLEDYQELEWLKKELKELISLVLDPLSELPIQVCHNDLNPGNLLLDKLDQGSFGVIDFGDITESPRVCELAIAASYASSLMPQPHTNYWEPAEYVRAGFESVISLTEPEAALFRPLVRLRLLQRWILNSAVVQSRPENRDYSSRYLNQLKIDIQASRPDARMHP